MQEVLQQIATIPLSRDLLREVDPTGIARQFRDTYKKLDDLKNFRTDYEKQNKLMRWWHNDKLRNAQLDSAEVQAEFSKVIGQLIVLNTIQAKALTEQQGVLNEQQATLQKQSDEIVGNTRQLESQHEQLANQSSELKNLVQDYFALKGLTDDGAKQLIEHAREIRATKQSVLDELQSALQQMRQENRVVTQRADTLEGTVALRLQAIHESCQKDMNTLRGDLQERVTSAEASVRTEQAQAVAAVVAEVAAVASDLQERVTSSEASVRTEQARAVAALVAEVAAVASNLSTQSSELRSRSERVESALKEHRMQLEAQQANLLAQGESLAVHHRATSGQIKKLAWALATLFTGLLGVVAVLAAQHA